MNGQRPRWCLVCKGFIGHKLATSDGWKHAHMRDCLSEYQSKLEQAKRHIANLTRGKVAA